MVFVACLLVVGLVLVAVAIASALNPRPKGLKGPHGLPLIGVGGKLALMPRKDVYPWINGMAKLYGGAYHLNVSGFKTLVVTDPKEAELVLNSVKHIQKGYEYFILKPWLRDGLLLSDGVKWHQRRKLLTPTFHFKILEDSLGRQAEHAGRFVRHILGSAGQPLRVEPAIRSSTLDVICDAALGLNMTVMNKQRQGYTTAIQRLTVEATQWYFSFWLHSNFLFERSSLGKSYYKHLKTVHDFSKKVILERKDDFIKTREVEQNDIGEKKRYAFLDRLLELDAEHPGGLSLVDIQEEVDTFTFEGHDTTSAAILFAMFALANHQVVQERAVEELTQIFGDSDRQPTRQDLNEMSYLEMVIKEVLRLYPSVPLFTRHLTENLVLSDGVVVPPGYNVMVFPLLIHRNPGYWDEPESFRPERFLPGTERHPYCYIPFSAGPRNCIGQKFAMMELKVIISTVLRRCKLEPVTRHVDLVPNVILATEEPIYVRVLPRE